MVRTIIIPKPMQVSKPPPMVPSTRPKLLRMVAARLSATTACPGPVKLITTV